MKPLKPMPTHSWSDCSLIWWLLSCLNLVLMAKEWNSLIEINLWTPLLHHELYHDFQMLAIWISYYHQMTTIFYVPFSTHLQSYTIILSTIKTQNNILFMFYTPISPIYLTFEVILIFHGQNKYKIRVSVNFSICT